MFNGKPSVDTAPVGNDTRIVPTSSSVALTVELGASQLYLSVELTQKQSIVQVCGLQKA